MGYAVKEIFVTLQGEGLQAGRAAVFLRFVGCNLWSGREADRPSAVCRFCDTDFVGGTAFADAASLADAVTASWPGSGRPLVVVTGGEPALQLDDALVAALHDRACDIAVETNGTRPLPAGLDWICVSPKAGTDLVITTGDELKLVYPQDGAPPEAFRALNFRHFLLQPKDGPDRAAHTRDAVAYCLAHPEWRLSLQTHKMIGIP
jgi:7-carboxy-7-deazaguanine synthase